MQITSMTHYFLPEGEPLPKLGVLVIAAAIIFWIVWQILKKKTKPKKR